VSGKPRVMVTRFEGGSPVARYWLANCKGFVVRGGAKGVVEELIHDADPYVTTRFVVRTRSRRRTVVSAERVATVVPAQRLLVVEPPHRERRARPHVPRPSLPRPSVRPPAVRRSAIVPFTARVARVAAAARRRLPEAAPAVALSRALAAVLVGSLRLLAAEGRATAVHARAVVRTTVTKARRPVRAGRRRHPKAARRAGLGAGDSPTR